MYAKCSDTVKMKRWLTLKKLTLLENWRDRRVRHSRTASVVHQEDRGTRKMKGHQKTQAATVLNKTGHRQLAWSLHASCAVWQETVPSYRPSWETPSSMLTLFYVYVCGCLHTCVQVSTKAEKGIRCPGVSVTGTWGYPVCMQGTELWSSVKAASILNGWATCPALVS